MYYQRLFLAAATFGLFNFASRCDAQGIRILDCNGQTRAVHQIPQALDYVVRVSIVDRLGQPQRDSEVTLTSREGNVSASTDVDGIAELTGVKPGVWLVGSPQEGLFYTSITLSDSIRGGFWHEVGSTAVDVLEVAAVAGVAVGAGVLIYEATDGDGGGGNDGGGNGDGGGSMPGDDCSACAPDASAPSVSGFRGR